MVFYDEAFGGDTAPATEQSVSVPEPEIQAADTVPQNLGESFGLKLSKEKITTKAVLLIGGAFLMLLIAGYTIYVMAVKRSKAEVSDGGDGSDHAHA